MTRRLRSAARKKAILFARTGRTKRLRPRSFSGHFRANDPQRRGFLAHGGAILSIVASIALVVVTGVNVWVVYESSTVQNELTASAASPILAFTYEQVTAETPAAGDTPTKNVFVLRNYGGPIMNLNVKIDVFLVRPSSSFGKRLNSANIVFLLPSGSIEMFASNENKVLAHIEVPLYFDADLGQRLGLIDSDAPATNKEVSLLAYIEVSYQDFQNRAHQDVYQITLTQAMKCNADQAAAFRKTMSCGHQDGWIIRGYNPNESGDHYAGLRERLADPGYAVKVYDGFPIGSRIHVGDVE